MNENEIKLAASRRGHALAPEGLALPPNMEEVMLNAEQWTVDYQSIQQLLEYAAVNVPVWPVFNRSVVLHVTNFPHENACNVICMLRTIEMDERWRKEVVPQLANTQFIAMAYAEHMQFWHQAIVGVGTGLVGDFVFKEGAPVTLGSLDPTSPAPAAHTINPQALHHALGLHFWIALQALEARGLAYRRKGHEGITIGVLTHAASSARN